jgi:hypothetical protein
VSVEGTAASRRGSTQPLKLKMTSQAAARHVVVCRVKAGIKKYVEMTFFTVHMRLMMKLTISAVT